jgi:deoxyribodipyrimidine photolyase-related protein
MPASTLFARALAERLHGPAARDRTWVYVPYDQLHDGLGLLAGRDPRTLGLVLVENPARAAARPYHQQKLALVLANQRHFALEQAARGVDVRYLVADGRGYAGALDDAARSVGPLVVHTPAERGLRVELAPLMGTVLHAHPHTGWLTTRDQFRRATPDGPPWRMDAFYRLVRRETGVLMDGDRPRGGRFSHDGDNRQPYRGSPPLPKPPRFEPDPITVEVGALIAHRYAQHPGRVDLTALSATLADAESLWRWALDACLPTFGPFEDAMTRRSSSLFHTRLAPLLNLHRLLPARVLADVLAASLPLASQEGFVRQVLGWREFVRHVHAETDGFRVLPDGVEARDGAPSALGAAAVLPPAYWGTASGLSCLDAVVADVWREAYTHHIPRLMVLGNLATLLDVSPRALTDWFWVAFADAYDWVVEPNVLGMATWGAGDVMTTKPYIAGAAYLHKMGDYCGGCAFDPKRDCPVTPLYWAFLGRHAARLGHNQRMAVPLAAQRKRTAAQRARDAAVFDVVASRLAAGRTVVPGDLPPAP